MPPTIRPSHGILSSAMQKVKARRVVGRVEVTLGPATRLDLHGGYNAANNQKVLPGMIVLADQALETDVGGIIVLRLENGLRLTINDKSHVFFQT